MKLCVSKHFTKWERITETNFLNAGSRLNGCGYGWRFLCLPSFQILATPLYGTLQDGWQRPMLEIIHGEVYTNPVEPLSCQLRPSHVPSWSCNCVNFLLCATPLPVTYIVTELTPAWDMDLCQPTCISMFTPMY